MKKVSLVMIMGLIVFGTTFVKAESPYEVDLLLSYDLMRGLDESREYTSNGFPDGQKIRGTVDRKTDFGMTLTTEGLYKLWYSEYKIGVGIKNALVKKSEGNSYLLFTPIYLVLELPLFLTDDFIQFKFGYEPFSLLDGSEYGRYYWGISAGSVFDWLILSISIDGYKPQHKDYGSSYFTLGLNLGYKFKIK